MKHGSAIRAVGATIVLLGTVAWGALPAFAATSATATSATATGQATVTPGGLTVTPSTDVIAMGTSQISAKGAFLEAVLPAITIDNLTGSDAGWNVTVQATKPTEITPSGGYASGTGPVPFKGFALLENQIGEVDAVPGEGTSFMNNQITGGDALYPQVVIDAVYGEGMGDYTYGAGGSNGAIDFYLDFPADQPLDNVNYPKGTPFETTITFTITSGPTA